MWQGGQIVLAGQIVLVWHLDQIILVGAGWSNRSCARPVGQIGFKGADLSDRSCVVDRSHGADRFE